jgi:hypothetical protein
MISYFVEIIQEIRKQPNIYLIKVNYVFLLLKLSSYQLMIQILKNFIA